ncbi:MAG: hypothetical protein KKD00_10710 [Gammaproteobacteria bacterium]|nr:hypothetical protein [Gammaproteobacteria bacterium]
MLEGTAGSVGPSVTASHSPAPVLDTPSTVPAGLLVNTSKPALALRIDVRQIKLVQADTSRTLTVDKNELIFAGRHIMAHDSLGVVEILVAGQICQDPVSAQWVPYSARVTLSNGEFIYGCAQDALLE